MLSLTPVFRSGGDGRFSFPASLWRLGALGLVVVSAAGCRHVAAAAATRFVDDAGDTVSVAAPVRRVASLIPATTELLFAIGAGNAVVGRTTWCDYPPAAARVTNLGDGINPTLEAVLAVRPDLVLLYNSAQNAAAAAHLRAFGIPAALLNTDRLEDVARVSRLLGRITGHMRESDSVVAVFDTALAAASPPPLAAARKCCCSCGSSRR